MIVILEIIGQLIEVLKKKGMSVVMWAGGQNCQ